jgi:fructose-1,6-bisphosphatase/inositol monophosphatase family enzyme
MSSTSEKLAWTSLAAALGCGVLYLAQRQRAKDAKLAIPQTLLSSPLNHELRVAVQLALRAGAAMYRYCDEKGTLAESTHDLRIATKGQPEDFCTKIDLENEQLITDGLLQHFPTHVVIGEETTGMGAIPQLTSDPTWIIDPIDGTTNFASGLPLTCVSIGLCVNGRPTLGVVYAPMTNELYLAVQGYGAYRNGVRIAKRIGKKLVDSVVCFEFGYARDKSAIAKMLTVVQRILENGCRTTRSLGSGVLDLCYVASGRMDVVYAGVAGEGWKPWDYCAGYVIAKEAGCALESIHATEQLFDLYSDSIICAAGDSLLREVRSIITR